jgi:hypothetical protein
VGSIVTGAAEPIAFRLCPSCAPEADGIRGPVVPLDILGLLLLGRAVGPERRLSSAERRGVRRIRSRLLEAASHRPAGPPSTELCAVLTLCRDCTSRLAELYRWSGPTVVLTGSACALLAPLAGPRRGRLSPADEERAAHLQWSIAVVAELALEPLRATLRGPEDEASGA